MDLTFDATWDSAFKESPYRLRFELGGEEFGCLDAPVPRFVQALSRARAIRDDVFADSARLWAIVASEADRSNEFDASASDGFKALSRSGFRANAVAEWCAPLFQNQACQSEDEFIWRAFDVTSDVASQDAVLWSSIAYEMPIKPKSPVQAHLADLERGILLYIYDDRGMDVTALALPPLLPIYARFDGWLLDYDRERMEAAFAGA